jgi:hypothetical protein
LYRAPEGVTSKFPKLTTTPPQTIISPPVQIAVCCFRADGALRSEVALHESVAGSYLPPVPTTLVKEESGAPPQTIISCPVQIAV